MTNRPVDNKIDSKTHVGWTLFQLILALQRSHNIENIDVEALRLPFDIDPARRVMRAYANAGSQPQRGHMLFMPYALGVWRCAQYMNQSKLTLWQLVSEPLTDEQLRRLLPRNA